MKLRNLFITLLLIVLGFTTASAQSLVLRHRDGTASVVRVTDSLKLQTAGGNISVISGTDTQTFNNDDILSITYRKGRSDVNSDYKTDISDVVAVINTIAGSGKEPADSCIADVNGDGKTDISDVVSIINVMAGTDNTPLPVIQTEDADYTSETGNAFYIYRNDGKFNAFLRADADSITFSKDKQLVHTPDSTYTIPLAVIDSVSFIIQKPVMQDGLFYLRDYHATHTTAIDSLTLYFDSGILSDSLPNVGQVMLTATEATPFEEGFVGKVVFVESMDGMIKVVCERAEIADVFKKLIVVGKVTSDAEEARSEANRRKINSDSWGDVETSDIISNIELDDMNLSVLDNLFSVSSKKPKLTCSYYVYIDETIYSIAADVYISHPDLTFGINFKRSNIVGIASDITDLIFGSVEDAQPKSAFEKFMEKGVPIPIYKSGFFNLSLKIAPQIKLEGDIEIDVLTKTSARQHIGFAAKGYTSVKLASMYSPFMSLIPQNALGSITDWSYDYVQDPVRMQSLVLKAEGGVKFGILAQLEMNLINKNWIHASVGVEYGLKAKAGLNVNLVESDYPSLNFYETIKDSKLEVKKYAKIKGDIGASPLKFWALKGEVDLFEKMYGSYYLLPHFTEPSFAHYDNGRWVNNLLSFEQFKPLYLYSSVSKDVLFRTGIGMVIEDNQGNVVKEVREQDPYRYETNWTYQPLKISVSGLEPGKTYTCYPTYCVIGSKYRNAYPYHKFTMPYPVSLSSESVKLNPEDSRVLRVKGGWGQYKLENNSQENVKAELVSHKDDKDSLVYDVYITALGLGSSVVGLTDIASGETVSLRVDVTGDPISNEAVKLSAGSIDFGTVQPGSKTTKQFDVTNERAVPVTFKVSETHGDFEIAGSGDEITLQPGETRSFDVVFTPSLSGRTFEKEVSLSFTNGSDVQTVSLTARTDGTDASVLQCPDGNHPHAIDMGFGVKFACCNVGASVPWEPGGYYAWGETEVSERPGWNVYTHCDGTRDTCHDLGDIAGTDKDVAATLWGSGWQMPGEEELQQLISSCSSVWTNINGMYGRLFTGSNGNKLFIPAAGHLSSIGNTGSNAGYYWSSLQYSEEQGYAIHFFVDETEALWGRTEYRCYGQSVRPVYDENSSSLKLSVNAIDFGSVSVGSSKSEEFTVTNVGKSSMSFTVSVSADVFEISDCGEIITLEPGGSKSFNVVFSSNKSDQYTSEIIIKSNNGTETHKITLTASTNDEGTQPSYLSCPDSNHPHIIDMGVAGKWACCNVGASAPWEYGGYYAWGETEEKSTYNWVTYIHCDGSYDTCHNIGDDISGTQYDVAHVKWGGKWRMPSLDQQMLLLDNCSSEWTEVNGINGRKFTAPNGGTIFLPAAGRRWYTDDVGSEGFYRSSTQNPEDSSDAYHLCFSRGYKNWHYNYRFIGCSVRPVTE